ncbi:VWA domain-containing protein [Candidatus Woesearchaeota archaeon]|nr:VWA domain-containing protein [Candidatus Woesearchaeota archaeon]MBW3016496.1 VWA domain-containing protein [Candidatus Woesearchaeota archaeon]
MVVVFDIEVKDISKGEEAQGKLHKQYVEDKLMNSVLESDKKTIEHAELIHEATNRSIGAFTPDMLYSQLVKNYSITKQLFGEKLIKLLTGYDPNYIEKNLKIPEFRKELQKAIYQNIEKLKEDEILDNEGMITEKGTELGSMILVKELDNYLTKDKIGEKINKKTKHYGEKTDTRKHKKGDRYKDLNMKRSVHMAIKRQHKKLMGEDLMTSQREGKGKVSIIYALDASASMKGKKLDTAKKAGITLAYKAIQDKDEVGVVVFGSEIKYAIPPTRNFPEILKAVSHIKASRQTDFAAMIAKSVELFPTTGETKHLIILTDALPTVGKEPEKETLQAVSTAKSAGITISLIGVQLDKAGIQLAKQITKIGEGRFSQVKNLEQVGQIVLEDYYALR